MYLNFEKRETLSIQQGPHFRGGRHEQYVRCTWFVHTSDGSEHTIIGSGSGWDEESAIYRARADASRLLHESLPEWGRLADEHKRKERSKERLSRDIAKMIENFKRHKTA